jgi:integrase/recombinase XerC
MKFSRGTDEFITDQRAQGRINSDKTEVAYRQVLDALGDDIKNRDPRTVNRDDIKRCLRRWPNPNTQASRRAALVSFFDYAMEEGWRKDNPARQVRRPKRRPTSVYRLTRVEATAMLRACETTRERRIVYLGLCAGLRSGEMRGLRGEHIQRPGWIWISSEIAKGARERWVPIISELLPVIEDARRTVALDHYVIAGGSAGGWGTNTFQREHPERPLSTQTLQRTVHRVAKNAGIAQHVHPHLLRHAFADHVARYAGLQRAQAVLGHADIQTTQGYVGKPTLEEIETSLAGLSYADELPPTEWGATPLTERGGFEPPEDTLQAGKRPSDITEEDV